MSRKNRLGAQQEAPAVSQTAPGSLVSSALERGEPAPMVDVVISQESLCTQISAAARAARSVGDHVGYAVMCEAESHLGQLRARLRESTGFTSPVVCDMVDKLKSLL